MNAYYFNSTRAAQELAAMQAAYRPNGALAEHYARLSQPTYGPVVRKLQQRVFDHCVATLDAGYAGMPDLVQ